MGRRHFSFDLNSFVHKRFKVRRHLLALRHGNRHGSW
jgi:hypothetical protein